MLMPCVEQLARVQVIDVLHVTLVLGLSASQYDSL